MIAETLALRELHRDAYASNDPQQVVMWHRSEPTPVLLSLLCGEE
jgi:hypothetical protein